VKLDAATAESALAELARRRALADGAGRADRIERHRSRGRLTGHERVALAIDPGSFIPIGRMIHGENLDEADRTIGGDGEIHGLATVDGRPVLVVANDPTVKGGTGSAANGRIGGRGIRLHCGLALFDLHQSGGARITELMSSKFAGAGGATMGARHVFGPHLLHLTAVLGDYYPPWNIVQAEFTAMVKTAHASLTSAPLLEVATGQREDPDDLAGADMQANVNGQVDVLADDEPSAIDYLRRVFAYLPARARDPLPRRLIDDPPDRRDESLNDVLPPNPNRAFDIRKVVTKVLDHDSFIEWSPGFARNLVTGLGRLDGWPVVVAANQPMVLAGTIDVPAMIKFRRILDLVNSYSLPLITFLDTPGVLTTKDQEHNRLIANVYQTSMARLRPAVPKVAVVVRKGIGFAYMMMSGGDPEGMTLCWPSARIAFTGPDPAARIVHASELAAAPDPAARQREFADEMRELSAPRLAAELGYVDAIIDPPDTRRVIIQSIAALQRRSAH
jgi:acetyl-CoA carboxylase carboxyltransferase component